MTIFTFTGHPDGEHANTKFDANELKIVWDVNERLGIANMHVEHPQYGSVSSFRICDIRNANGLRGWAEHEWKKMSDAERQEFIKFIVDKQLYLINFDVSFGTKHFMKALADHIADLQRYASYNRHEEV